MNTYRIHEEGGGPMNRLASTAAGGEGILICHADRSVRGDDLNTVRSQFRSVGLPVSDRNVYQYAAGQTVPEEVTLDWLVSREAQAENFAKYIERDDPEAIVLWTWEYSRHFLDPMSERSQYIEGKMHAPFLKRGLHISSWVNLFIDKHDDDDTWTSEGSLEHFNDSLPFSTALNISGVLRRHLDTRARAMRYVRVMEKGIEHVKQYGEGRDLIVQTQLFVRPTGHSRDALTADDAYWTGYVLGMAEAQGCLPLVWVEHRSGYERVLVEHGETIAQGYSDGLEHGPLTVQASVDPQPQGVE